MLDDKLWRMVSFCLDPSEPSFNKASLWRSKPRWSRVVPLSAQRILATISIRNEEKFLFLLLFLKSTCQQTYLFLPWNTVDVYVYLALALLCEFNRVFFKKKTHRLFIKPQNVGAERKHRNHLITTVHCKFHLWFFGDYQGFLLDHLQ